MEQIVAAGSVGHVSKGHTACPALQVTVPGGLSEEQAGVNHAQKRYQGGCEAKLTMDFQEPKWHMFRTELGKERHTTYYFMLLIMRVLVPMLENSQLKLETLEISDSYFRGC